MTHSQVMTVQHIMCDQWYLSDMHRGWENAMETSNERAGAPGHLGPGDKSHGRAGF